jgi:3-deoxy-manno-octulosonate cytidylyltransferase (CMP-KDO synthetase)
MSSVAGAEVVAIIPARLGSTRFPGKVLADRTGKPLIQHVWESTKRAGSLSRVVIATDDERVMTVARGFGAEAVMTSTEHPNGTSRLAEAATKLGLAADAIVVNVQGDEPELDPSVIDDAVGALVRGEAGRGAGAAIATAATVMGAGERADDPNVVKVVLSRDGFALYFSRSRIPFDRDGSGGGGGEVARCLRHIGLYVYRRATLERYAAMALTPLEQAEKLEQLRALENGLRIAVAIVRPEATGGGGIDTPEQYEAFVRRVSVK